MQPVASEVRGSDEECARGRPRGGGRAQRTRPARIAEGSAAGHAAGGKATVKLAAIVACAALTLPCAARAAARFAVVVGNNHGATGRARLWFAEKDAERFARALHELGDFSSDRIVVLQGATPSAVHEALAAMEARIASAKASGERSLLVVYFSGHAGPQGLEMGDQRIPYDELR